MPAFDPSQTFRCLRVQPGLEHFLNVSVSCRDTRQCQRRLLLGWNARIGQPIFNVGEQTVGNFAPAVRSWVVMNHSHPGLGTNILLGGIAGFVATAAMTSGMTRLHRLLSNSERYPLPPREIAERVFSKVDESTVRNEAIAAHFLYGAATGALVVAARPRLGPIEGALAGVLVWSGSYFGWVPALGILKPASAHPGRRNALMIGAHLVWGAGTAIILHELALARATILSQGPLRDAPA